MSNLSLPHILRIKSRYRLAKFCSLNFTNKTDFMGIKTAVVLFYTLENLKIVKRETT